MPALVEYCLWCECPKDAHLVQGNGIDTNCTVRLPDSGITKVVVIKGLENL